MSSAAGAGTGQPAALALDGVTRRYAGREAQAAVDNVSLTVPPGQLLALLGASGSGKTTTLRIAAGYEPADTGRVLLDGADVTAMPPAGRGFGMVFQHYALFPHMNVEENVAFGLEARGVSRAMRLDRARRALAAAGLQGAGARRVQALSGGEQQRVALARALVIEPRVLLLDEPLSNLDPLLRRTMREELRALLHREQVTALFVTHDQEDAFAVADQVAILEHGRLLQVGAPELLYHRPATRAVAQFIGRATLVPAFDRGSHAAVCISGIENRVAVTRPATGGEDPLGEVLLVLRPEQLALASTEARDVWPGTVRERRFLGSAFAYQVELHESVLFEVASADGTAQVGDRVGVRVAREPVAMVRA